MYPAASVRGMGGSRRPRGEVKKIKETFFKLLILALKVKILRKTINTQKFSQFYVTYHKIEVWPYDLWKLEYFEKIVLELMADLVFNLCPIFLNLLFIITPKGYYKMETTEMVNMARENQA